MKLAWIGEVLSEHSGGHVHHIRYFSKRNPAKNDLESGCNKRVIFHPEDVIITPTSKRYQIFSEDLQQQRQQQQQVSNCMYYIYISYSYLSVFLLKKCWEPESGILLYRPFFLGGVQVTEIVRVLGEWPHSLSLFLKPILGVFDVFELFFPEFRVVTLSPGRFVGGVLVSGKQ